MLLCNEFKNDQGSKIKESRQFVLMEQNCGVYCISSEKTFKGVEVLKFYATILCGSCNNTKALFSVVAPQLMYT